MQVLRATEVFKNIRNIDNAEFEESGNIVLDFSNIENIDLNTHSHIYKYDLCNTIWLDSVHDDMYKHIIECQNSWIKIYDELTVELQNDILKKEQMICAVHREQMLRKYEDMQIIRDNNDVVKSSVPNFSLK